MDSLCILVSFRFNPTLVVVYLGLLFLGFYVQVTFSDFAKIVFLFYLKRFLVVFLSSFSLPSCVYHGWRDF